MTRLRGASAGLAPGEVAPEADVLPHVVAWNLTRRCNLACAHCYISAGSWHAAAEELDTARCLEIVDQVLEASPDPLLILSGGEPLVRDDLETIAARASRGGATVVVGTNGTGLTRERIASLKAAGVRGVAVSVDSLESTYHDRFRHGEGALAATLDAVERLRAARLDFLVQTTLTSGNRGEVDRLVAWAADRGAVCINFYFLVQTGRARGMDGLSAVENEEVLRRLSELQREYRGRLMIRSKCAPQLMRIAHERDPDSPLGRYRTRCPCGVHYCRITPEGKVTPCPYLPEVAGDLAEASFADIWEDSPLFRRLRGGELGGRCGRCEYREVCGGCRARAHAATGDVLSEDPACAYEPPGDRPTVRPDRGRTYGAPTETALSWSPAARDRLERIPSFVRGVVAERVEAFARRNGHRAVTPEVMDEVRRAMPVDFSKRLPFFARSGGDGDS